MIEVSDNILQIHMEKQLKSMNEMSFLLCRSLLNLNVPPPPRIGGDISGHSMPVSQHPRSSFTILQSGLSLSIHDFDI